MIQTASFRLARTRRGDAVALSILSGDRWTGTTLDLREAAKLRDGLIHMLQDVSDLERDTATEP